MPNIILRRDTKACCKSRAELDVHHTSHCVKGIKLTRQQTSVTQSRIAGGITGKCGLDPTHGIHPQRLTRLLMDRTDLQLEWLIQVPKVELLVRVSLKSNAQSTNHYVKDIRLTKQQISVTQSKIAGGITGKCGQDQTHGTQAPKLIKL